MFTVADNEADAKQRAMEELSAAEFMTDTPDCSVEFETIREISEEHIEEAAIRVLGWHAPE
jgi:hypothetical protein